MQGYTLSVSARTKAKSYGMKTAEYMIYADLRAAGWCQRDAWSVAFQGVGLNWDKAELEREMNKLESLDSVKKRIADVRDTHSGASDKLSPEELAKATSKEQILTDLVVARKKMKEGTKEWTEQTRLIAEYARIKQDEIQTEDTTVHFFLPANYPLSCKDCLIFKSGLAESQKNS